MIPVHPEWMKRGACLNVNPALFFPHREDLIEDTREAKAVCATCRVCDECLVFGMGERYGIWGGLTANDRKALKRHRRSVA